MVVLRRRRPPLGRRVDDPGRSQRPRRRLRRRRYALDRGVRLVLRVGIAEVIQKKPLIKFPYIK